MKIKFTFFTIIFALIFLSANSYGYGGQIVNKIKFFTDIEPVTKPSEYAVTEPKLLFLKEKYRPISGDKRVDFLKSIKPSKKPKFSTTSKKINISKSYDALKGAERLLYYKTIKARKKPAKRTFYKRQPAKKLHFYNTHTNESINIVFYQGGYIRSALKKLNYFFRDHRSGEVINMDPKLFLLAHEVYRRVGGKSRIEVISGYRSKRTNAIMRAQGRNVAKKSLHTTGQAMDIRIPGVSLRKLRDTALRMRAGGVGYYPKSNFVHIDTGDVRRW